MIENFLCRIKHLNEKQQKLKMYYAIVGKFTIIKLKSTQGFKKVMNRGNKSI